MPNESLLAMLALHRGVAVSEVLYFRIFEDSIEVKNEYWVDVQVLRTTLVLEPVVDGLNMRHC